MEKQTDKPSLHQKAVVTFAALMFIYLFLKVVFL